MIHRFPGVLWGIDSEARLSSLRKACKRRLVLGIRPVRLMYSHRLLSLSGDRNFSCSLYEPSSVHGRTGSVSDPTNVIRSLLEGKVVITD